MEQVIGTTVEARGRNNLVSGLGNVQDGEGFGGLPGGCRQRPNPALERRYPFLENRPSGIHDAGVDVAEFLQGEKVSGVSCVFENVRSGLVNRDGARPGCRIGKLSCVQSDRVETKFSFQCILLSDLSWPVCGCGN